MRDCTGRRVHLIAAKASRDAEEAPVHLANVRSRTLPRVDLCHLCPCSILLPYRRCVGCLLISQNPALHTCPSIRVEARFLPLTWVEATAIPCHPWVHLFRGVARSLQVIITLLPPHPREFLQRPYQANIQSRLRRVTPEGAYYVGVR